jgi:hypothetical protein
VDLAGLGNTQTLTQLVTGSILRSRGAENRAGGGQDPLTEPGGTGIIRGLSRRGLGARGNARAAGAPPERWGAAMQRTHPW